MYFHSSSALTTIVSISSPSAYNLTVMYLGLWSRWSSSPSQVLVPLTSVLSGVWVLVIVTFVVFSSMSVILEEYPSCLSSVIV